MSSTLEVLLEMGFSKSKAEKAINATTDQGIEAAMEWILIHNDELDAMESEIVPMEIAQQTETSTSSNIEDKIDAAEASSGDNITEGITNQSETAKSLKCEDCGKLFKDEIEVEFHAAKSGHQNFSESVEEIRPLTEEEKKDQIKKLEEKIKQRRLEKEEEQRRTDVEKEKMRRRTGQQVIETKKKMEEEEIRKLAEQRRREKIEEKLAKQRVLDDIERDKEARKKKFENIASSTDVPLSVASNPKDDQQPVSLVKKEYTETKLQIRLTNGTTLNQSFGPKEELAAVRLYVEMNRTDGTMPFSLMTNFPKKIFTEEDMEKPLYQLGLVPSAVLIVTKGK